MNKELIAIIYPSEEEYEKQVNLPIEDKIHYTLKLDPWEITN